MKRKLLPMLAIALAVAASAYRREDGSKPSAPAEHAYRPAKTLLILEYDNKENPCSSAQLPATDYRETPKDNDQQIAAGELAPAVPIYGGIVDYTCDWYAADLPTEATFIDSLPTSASSETLEYSFQ